MMRPGVHGWRARHGGADLGAWAEHWGCGPSFAERVWAERRASGERYGDFAGGAFGVRRPLRFLAFKLDLDERQVAELAKILSELKTERAQAEVDSRRTLAGVARPDAGRRVAGAARKGARGLGRHPAPRAGRAGLEGLGRIP